MSDWILGSVSVTNKAVVTHRDSYLLQTLTAVSVRRPLLVPAIVISAALVMFALGTFDLLYWSEFIGLALVIAVSLIAGTKLGQLQLLSRDLKNTELSGAIWGHHAALQTVRSQIVAAMQDREIAP